MKNRFGHLGYIWKTPTYRARDFELYWRVQKNDSENISELEISTENKKPFFFNCCKRQNLRSDYGDQNPITRSFRLQNRFELELFRHTRGCDGKCWLSDKGMMWRLTADGLKSHMKKKNESWGGGVKLFVSFHTAYVDYGFRHGRHTSSHKQRARSTLTITFVICVNFFFFHISFGVSAKRTRRQHSKQWDGVLPGSGVFFFFNT